MITASNRNLQSEVAAKRFRADLLYRIAVIDVNIPPLRDRGKDDILLLTKHFIFKLSVKRERHIKGISTEACELLQQYPWPGNVRELENAIEHAIVMANGNWIDEAAIPIHIRTFCAQLNKVDQQSEFTAQVFRGQLQHGFPSIAKIRETIDHHKGNKRMAAKVLGISRDQLYRQLKQHQEHN